MTNEKQITLGTPIFPSMPIWGIGLSWRPSEVLLNAGLRKVRDVIECSAEELLQIPNFGPKCLAEVEAILAPCRLALRDPNTEKVHIPLFPPEPPKPKYINRWFYVPEEYPSQGQVVLFYCANGAAFLGRYVKELGWFVAQPKDNGHDWGTLIRITADVLRWLPMPDPDYDQEFA